MTVPRARRNLLAAFEALQERPEKLAKTAEPNHFDRLPDEMVQEVFFWAIQEPKAGSLKTVAAVCSRWRALAEKRIVVESLRSSKKLSERLGGMGVELCGPISEVVKAAEKRLSMASKSIVRSNNGRAPSLVGKIEDLIALFRDYELRSSMNVLGQLLGGQVVHWPSPLFHAEEEMVELLSGYFRDRVVHKKYLVLDGAERSVVLHANVYAQPVKIISHLQCHEMTIEFGGVPTPYLSSCTELKKLSFKSCSMRALPSSVGALVKLETLSFSKLRNLETCSPELVKLSRLQTIRFDEISFAKVQFDPTLTTLRERGVEICVEPG